MWKWRDLEEIYVFCVSKNSRSRILLLVFFRWVLWLNDTSYSKCLNAQIVSCLLGTLNFLPCRPTTTLRTTMHSYGQTDGQHDNANSLSYCVAVRSAKSAKDLRRRRFKLDWDEIWWLVPDWIRTDWRSLISDMTSCFQDGGHKVISRNA